MNEKIKDELLHLYNTPSLPSSFGGVDRLYKQARSKNPLITKKIVMDFLKTQPAHTLHRNTDKRFTRRRVIAPRPKIIASMDLADMRNLASFNGGFKYILVFIDVFSRFLHATCLKKKDGRTVAIALQSIINSEDFHGVRKLNSDKGGEFYNKPVQEYLKKIGVILYSVHSIEIKAAIAERVIRTLKNKIYKYLTDRSTMRYIDVLPKLVDSYNNSPHRGLGEGQTPKQVHNITNSEEIKAQFDRMYKRDIQTTGRIISPLAVGETVRISDNKRNIAFRKGFTVQNTYEIFRIKKVDRSYHPTVYYLEDLQGENIEGLFYREEIIPCTLPVFYDIEIIKSKVSKGKKYFFVRWKGYPDQFNSWIDESYIKQL